MQPPTTSAARLWQAIVRLGLADRTQKALAAEFGVGQSVVQGWSKGVGGVSVDKALALEASHRINAAFVILARGEPLLDHGQPVGDYEAGFWDGRRSGLMAAAEAVLGVVRQDEATLTPTKAGSLPLDQAQELEAESRRVAPVPQPKTTRKGRRRAG